MWTISPYREDGSTFLPEDVAYFSLYQDGELLDTVTTTEYEITKYRGCHVFQVTVTDTNDLVSELSNNVEVCHNKRNKRN